MRKVFLIMGCIILAGGLVGLDYWQGYNQGLVSEQLVQDNIEIQQLLNEKTQMEEASQQATTEEKTPVENTETSAAVLCFNSLNQSFYTEVYPVVKEKVDSGIFVLENGKLPSDDDYISTQDFSELIDNGWVCAISLERDADDASWKSNIEQYLTALNDRVSAKPAVYYLSSGSCTEADAQILKELGFETVLCHEQTAAKTVGELNVVQLLGYNDTDVAGSISSIEGNCGLEIWVSWDKSVRTRVRYTSAALQNLLNNSTITLTGLDDMLNGEPVSVSQTPEERISQIDQRLDELYH